MITENLSTLKIHKLKTQEQFDKAKDANTLEDNAFYLIPEAEEKVVYKNFFSSSDELILDDIHNTSVDPIIVKMPLNLFHIDQDCPIVGKPLLGGSTSYGVTITSNYSEGLLINGTSTNANMYTVPLFSYYIGMNMHDSYSQNAGLIFDDERVDKTFTIDLRGLQDLKCSFADGSEFTPLIQVSIENSYMGVQKWFQYARDFNYFTTIDFNNLEYGDYLFIALEIEPSVTFNNSRGYMNILRGSYTESDLKPYVAGSRSGHYGYGGAGTLTVYKGNKTEPYTSYEYLGAPEYSDIHISLCSPTARITDTGSGITLGIKYNIAKPEPNCIKGTGAPSQTLVGSVGSLYMDTNNGYLYQCRGEEDVGIYTWEKIASNKMDKFGTVSGTTAKTTSATFELANSSSNATLKYTSGTSQLKGSSSVILKAPSINLQPYSSTSGQIAINNVKTPTSNYQAANKYYVDNSINTAKNTINSTISTKVNEVSAKLNRKSGSWGAYKHITDASPIEHDLDIQVVKYEYAEEEVASFASMTIPYATLTDINPKVSTRPGDTIRVTFNAATADTSMTAGTIYLLSSSSLTVVSGAIELNTGSTNTYEFTIPESDMDSVISRVVFTTLNSTSFTITDFVLTRVGKTEVSPTGVSVTKYGKNLLPSTRADSSSTAYTGLTFTNNADGSITANGSNPEYGAYYWFIPQNSLLLPPGTYKFSAGITGSADSYYVGFKYGDYETYSYSNGAFILTEPTLCGVCFSVAKGQTLDNLTVYPQVELEGETGAEATSYEPYNEQTAVASADGRVLGLRTSGSKMTIKVNDDDAAVYCGYYVNLEGAMDTPISKELTRIENKILYGSLGLGDLPEDAPIGTIYVQVDESN